MPQVIFAPAAIRDLERLRAFLRDRNALAARRASAAIIKGVENLGAYPRLGRIVEDLPEIYRDWLIDFGDSGYLVRYRVDANRVTILRIRHQKEEGF